VKFNIAEIKNTTLLTGIDFTKYLLTDFTLARCSIMICSYVFDIRNLKENPCTASIIDTLIFAREKKINIEILLNGYKKSGGIKKLNTGTCLFFADKKISCSLFSPLTTQHSKIVLIDDDIVYLGSHNFTEASFTKSTETTLRIVSVELNNTLKKIIEELKERY